MDLSIGDRVSCTRSNGLQPPATMVGTAEDGLLHLEYYQGGLRVVNRQCKMESISFAIPSSDSPPHCPPSPPPNTQSSPPPKAPGPSPLPQELGRPPSRSPPSSLGRLILRVFPRGVPGGSSGGTWSKSSMQCAQSVRSVQGFPLDKSTVEYVTLRARHRDLAVWPDQAPIV